MRTCPDGVASKPTPITHLQASLCEKSQPPPVQAWDNEFQSRVPGKHS